MVGVAFIILIFLLITVINSDICVYTHTHTHTHNLYTQAFRDQKQAESVRDLILGEGIIFVEVHIYWFPLEDIYRATDGLLSFLNMEISIYHQIWCILNHYFLNFFMSPFLSPDTSVYVWVFVLNVCMCVCKVTSVVSDSLRPHGL